MKYDFYSYFSNWEGYSCSVSNLFYEYHEVALVRCRLFTRAVQLLRSFHFLQEDLMRAP